MKLATIASALAREVASISKARVQRVESQGSETLTAMG